ncbi:hypothetical protein BJH93_15645 [Kocuria polaris]|nr:hypothetical protein [Kocuria polaris]
MNATRSQRGDEVTAVLTANSADLLAYFQRRVQQQDAADLVAETMMTAWRRVDDLPAGAEPARMWLFGIARNVLANAERGERRRWRLANKLRLMLGRGESAAAADSGAEVRDAVANLGAEQAELIRLVHWDGFTLKQAADVLGMPPSTARGRYAQAKVRLAELLAEDDVEPPPTLTGKRFAILRERGVNV